MKKYFALLALVTGTLVPTFASASNDCMGDECGKLMRADCRYHNTENHAGVGFCYSSIVYRVGERGIQDIRFGIGCDNQTLYNDRGRYVPEETTLDRISPRTAATPAIELKPQGALRTEGVYESTADILNFGRMDGRCYVTEVHYYGHPLD